MVRRLVAGKAEFPAELQGSDEPGTQHFGSNHAEKRLAISKHLFAMRTTVTRKASRSRPLQPNRAGEKRLISSPGARPSITSATSRADNGPSV